MARLRWNIDHSLSGILRREFRPSRSCGGSHRTIVMVSARECGGAGSPAFGPASSRRRRGRRRAHPRGRFHDARRRGFARLGRGNLPGDRPAPLVGFRDAHAGGAPAPRFNREVGGVGFRARRHRRLDVHGADDYADRYNRRTPGHRHSISRGARATQHGRRPRPCCGDEAGRECVVADTTGPLA